MEKTHLRRELGGWRQRVAAEVAQRQPSPSRQRSRSPRRHGSRADAIAGVPVRNSEIARELCFDWAWGLISSVKVARYCRACVADGIVHPVVRRLASFGGWGSSDHNVSSQMLTMLFKHFKSQHLITRIDNSAVGCMLEPHRLFSAVYKMSPVKVAGSFGMSTTKCFLFWEAFFATRDGALMRDVHPHLQGKTAEDLQTTLPLNFHADAGPFSIRHSALAFSWASVFAIGSEMETRLLIATWVKGASALPERVWPKVWDSFSLLASGRDAAGLPLAEDSEGRLWGGVIAFGLADMEFWVVDVGMQGYNHNSICGWCLANRSDKPWTDLGTTAAWQRSRCSNTEFLARLRPGHGLLSWPGLNTWMCRLDPLHINDYKGCSSLIFGSIVWDIVRPGNEHHFAAVVHGGCVSIADRLEAVDSLYCSHCKAFGISHRLPPISFRALFGDLSPQREYAQLRGPGVKGASTRAAMPFILWLANRFNDGTEVGHHRAVVAETCVGWYKLIYAAGLVLTESEYEAQLKLVIRCLRSYKWLAWEAQSRGILLWKLIPKLHYWMELAFQANSINPRYAQTYAGESLVGRVSTMYKGSFFGPYKRVIQEKVLKKYLIGLEIQFAGCFGG